MWLLSCSFFYLVIFLPTPRTSVATLVGSIPVQSRLSQGTTVVLAVGARWQPMEDVCKQLPPASSMSPLLTHIPCGLTVVGTHDQDRPLSWKIPRSLGQRSPCATGAESTHSRAHMPQEKPRDCKAHAPWQTAALHSPQLEKAHVQQQRPSPAKNYTYINLNIYRERDIFLKNSLVVWTFPLGSVIT